MYRHLSIDIGNNNDDDDKVTIENSLKNFFRPEIRDLKCEKCIDGIQAQQTLRIVSKPKLLLLHLKRFIVVERIINPPPVEIHDIENQSPNIDKTKANNSLPNIPTQVEYIFKKNKAPIEIPPCLSLNSFLNESSNIEFHNCNNKEKMAFLKTKYVHLQCIHRMPT